MPYCTISMTIYREHPGIGAPLTEKFRICEWQGSIGLKYTFSKSKPMHKNTKVNVSSYKHMLLGCSK